MNKKKTKPDKLVVTLGVVFAIALSVMILALCNPKEETGSFTPPAFDSSAVEGIPTVPDGLGYGELFQEGMAYRFSVCGNVTMDGNAAILYFTNPESNNKWLKLRVMDADGNILGETGIIKPGEYVQSAQLSEVLSPGTIIKLKIMGYEPDTYTSAGSVSLNTTVGGVPK